MKNTLLLLLLFISSYSYSQIVPRSTNTSNTLTDERLLIKQILVIPRYTDTTAANLKKGEDSTGAMIQTYGGGVSRFWVRKGLPKRWIQSIDAETINNFIDTSTGTITGYTDSAARAANGYSANVKWYGVVGDGRRSDSVGVKAAIAFVAIKGGKVYFPAGKYRLPPLKIPDRVGLVGEGNSHSSIDVPANTYTGTLLLVDGIAGKSDIEFTGNTSSASLSDMSIWNNNNAAIESVVKIPGVLYPHLTNIEISSVVHTTGIGLYILGYNVAPWFFSSLYSTYLNVNVITNALVGVRIGLKLWGISNTLPPNASRFFGGHFQGYELSLLVDGAEGFGPYSGAQGVLFSGTTFESYFNAAQRVEYVPNSVGMAAFSEDSSRYGVIWMNVRKGNQITFDGCYYENGGVPFSAYNDGTNGTHRAFPMVLLDTNSSQIEITGGTLSAGILDRGILNTFPNKKSYIDEYGFGTIVERATKGFVGSEIEVSTNGVKGFRQRKDTSFTRKLIIEDFVADTLKILKKTGAIISLGDSINGTYLKTKPIGTTTSHFIIATEGQEQLEVESARFHIKKRLKLTPTEIPINTGAETYIVTYDSTDSLVKRAVSYPIRTTTLDFPSTDSLHSSDLTYTFTGATVGMIAMVNSQTVNPANSNWSAFVSAINTITIRFNNYSSIAIDPTSGVFSIKLIP